MAIDKLVDSGQLDTDLTTVANAIRSKGGTSGSLSFPSGMASAISNIPVGITDISTAAEMDATLITANVGKWYRYTGTTTSSYVNGRIYGVEDNTDYLCFTAQQANSTVGMTVRGTPSRGQAFQYSRDKKTWSTFTPGSTTITLSSVGDKVYFKGNNSTFSESEDTGYRFSMTGRIAGSGNLMSLLDSTCASVTTVPTYCFVNLFRDCTSITSAPNLLATTVKSFAAYRMFFRCTNLTTPPILSATNVDSKCYGETFNGCTSLATAPALPAMTLAGACYSSMFCGCSSLTTPPALPATSLANYCYQYMFQNCTNLTSVPELRSTGIYTGCYAHMFYGCTKLYASDTQTSSAPYAWTIPTNGTFSSSITFTDAFRSCLGTRSSDSFNAVSGSSKTYYTQNPPISA